MTEQSVVVTGVSTGIGAAIAEVLVAKEFTVFGTVRKQTDADRLQGQFGPAFIPLIMDVTDQDAITAAASQVREALGKATLAGLVNNAGMAVAGPLIHLPAEQFRKQMEVNLTAPFAITQVFAPLLGTDRSRLGNPGRIVNISSVGGRIGAPFLGAYAASKHALEGMSESLRRELMLYGIEVIIIEPGYVKTPILDKAEAEDFSMYDRTAYAPSLNRFRKMFLAEGRKGLPPAAISAAVHKALTVKKPKTTYTVVKGKFQNWTLLMSLPKRILDRIIARQLGMLPPPIRA